MSQLTIQISEKGGALIAQLQKEIFQRRRKKVSAEGVIETLIESGAKSQSDKRFATSWKNLIADIEKAAKVAQTHGAKPANLSDAEWALVLAHRTRSGGADANQPKARASASRSKTTTPKAPAKPRSTRRAAPKVDTSAVAVAAKPSRAKATPSRAKAAPTTKAKASSRAKPLAAPVPATEVPEASTAAVGSTPALDTPAPAAPLSAATTRRTRTRSTAITGAKPRTNTSPAARRMAKAVTRLGMGSSTSKAAASKASPAAPNPISYPSTGNGPASGPDSPAE